MANINKNIIMQAGAAVANATNKAAGLSASTPEPGTIISAIQLVNGGRTIGPDALAHFTESVRNKLLSLLVTLNPIQDFNGYDHPWPAGGGINKFGSEIEQGGFYANGTNTPPTETNYNIRIRSKDFISVTEGGTYTVSFASTGTPLNVSVSFYATNSYSDERTGSINWGTSPQTFTVPSGSNYIRLLFKPTDSSTLITPTAVSDIQVEVGSTAHAWQPYSNICTIGGRTGANTYVSPTPNEADATTYAADWATPAGTVYAGSADIVTGDIKAAPYYASYNGETLVGPWVSSMDIYDPDGTPSTGAQVVDLGGAMTEYHITGHDIITLVGDNYIWSDSGDVTITE